MSLGLGRVERVPFDLFCSLEAADRVMTVADLCASVFGAEKATRGAADLDAPAAHWVIRRSQCFSEDNLHGELWFVRVTERADSTVV